MGREAINREKEPFHQAEPGPVKFGDMMVSYGSNDPVTRENIRKLLLDEETRLGTPVTGQEDGADRIKDLTGDYQLRRYKPHYFWRVHLNGTQVETLGNYTDLAIAEVAAIAHQLNAHTESLKTA